MELAAASSVAFDGSGMSAAQTSWFQKNSTLTVSVTVLKNKVFFEINIFDLPVIKFPGTLKGALPFLAVSIELCVVCKSKKQLYPSC